MMLEFELANPAIEIIPKRRDYLTLKIEYTQDTVSTIINEIAEKRGFTEIFNSFCINELEEMKIELEEYTKDLKF